MVDEIEDSDVIKAMRDMLAQFDEIDGSEVIGDLGDDDGKKILSAVKTIDEVYTRVSSDMDAFRARKARQIVKNLMDNLISAKCIDLPELIPDVGPEDFEWLEDWAGCEKRHP